MEEVFNTASVKDLRVTNIYGDGAQPTLTSLSGGTISIQDNATASKIFVGRVGSAGNTTVLFRNRTDTSNSSMFWDPQYPALVIGKNSIQNTNAILDLNTTSLAFKPPVLTTAQADLLSGAGNGLMWYNSTLGQLEYVSGSRIFGVRGTIR